MIIYTGIGNSNVPIKILNNIYKISKIFAINNFLLRSGGCIGCDEMFEKRMR